MPNLYSRHSSFRWSRISFHFQSLILSPKSQRVSAELLLFSSSCRKYSQMIPQSVRSGRQHFPQTLTINFLKAHTAHTLKKPVTKQSFKGLANISPRCFIPSIFYDPLPPCRRDFLLMLPHLQAYKTLPASPLPHLPAAKSALYDRRTALPFSSIRHWHSASNFPTAKKEPPEEFLFIGMAEIISVLRLRQLLRALL